MDVVSNVRIIPSRLDSNPHSPIDYTLKWLTVGDSGVGKTTALEVSLGTGTFEETQPLTIGIEFFACRGLVEYLNAPPTDYKLQVWDCSGQDRFRSIVKSYYRHANIISVLYSVNDRTSFHGVRDWCHHIRQELGTSNYIMLLVATQCDTHSNDRCVSMREATELAEELGFERYLEMSAKDGNVMAVFEAGLLIANEAIQSRRLHLMPPTINQKSAFKLEVEDSAAEKTGCVNCFVM